ISLALCVVRTFLSTNDYMSYIGRIPYSCHWIGFIQTPANETHLFVNAKNLFRSKNFLLSLSACKGLIVFSEELRSWVASHLNKLGFGQIPVTKVCQPGDPNQLLFNDSQIKNLGNIDGPKLVQLYDKFAN